MSDIQDEAYSEAMEEIGHLKSVISSMRLCLDAQGEEIKLQRHLGNLYLDLLKRTAEALDDVQRGFKKPDEKLIEELKNAAKDS